MYIITVGKSFSVAEARAHLPDILDEVEAGKEVHLTRRGRAIAVLLSPERLEALRRERTSFGEAFRAFAERHAPGDIGLEPDFFDAVRDRSTGRKVRL
jgi:prevent-host-death family protein